MIGIVVVTHGNLGKTLIETVESILNEKLEAVESVSVSLKIKADELRKDISKSVKKVSQDKGALIFTDMFGGTPSNLSYSFLEEGRIEVLTGINLPILLKAVTERKNTKLTDLAGTLEPFGKNSISLASSILKGNKKT